MKIGRLIPLAVLASSLSVAHADDAAVKKAIQVKYDTFAKAFLAKDADAVAKIAAPGFTTNGPNGKLMDAKAAMAMLKQQMQMTPPGATASFKITKVTVKGDKATVQTTGHMSMSTPGQDKKTHTMAMDSTSTDKWVKIGGDWKILEYREKPGAMTMDGKKVNMGATAGAGAHSGSTAPKK